MNNKDIIIRRETEQDHHAVENLVREAFWNVYRPGCVEHYVLHKLRDNADFVPELDFVMEKGGILIGQNIFMRANIKTDNGQNVPVMAMGPISIAPEFKRQGYGKLLLDYCLEKAAELTYGKLPELKKQLESLENEIKTSEENLKQFIANKEGSEKNISLAVDKKEGSYP